MSATAHNVVVLDDYRDSEPELVTVPPGDYEGVYIRHACVKIFRTPKVRVDFKLLEHPGITLSRWYRASHNRGRISSGKSSDIVRELSAVLGYRVRGDRIPVCDLAGRVIRVKVKTVTADSRQNKLADVNRYSVISQLIGAAQ